MLLGRIAARRSATLSARARQLTPEALLKERSRTKDGYGVAGACPYYDCGRRGCTRRLASDGVRPFRGPHVVNRIKGTRRARVAVVAEQDGIHDGRGRRVRPSHALVAASVRAGEAPARGRRSLAAG